MPSEAFGKRLETQKALKTGLQRKKPFIASSIITENQSSTS
jgi:hypothetical protein